MQEIAALCDEVVVIAHGRVVAQGTPAELRDRAGTESLEEAFVRLVGAAGAGRSREVSRPMRAIWRVFLKEFRENLRDRRTLISALIFGPLFGPLLIASALSLSLRGAGSQGRSPAAPDRSARGTRAGPAGLICASTMSGSGPSSDDEAAARSEVAAHPGEEVLLVPADFGSRLEAGQPAPLLLVRRRVRHRNARRASSGSPPSSTSTARRSRACAWLRAGWTRCSRCP